MRRKEASYVGFNDCHLTEKLREVEGLPLSRSTVRRLQLGLGLPATRRRRGRQGRMRRMPEAQMGALVQLDASPFAWLGDRRPALSLHGAIDDATGTGLALYFRPLEALHGYAPLLRTLGATHGLPLALYSDRFGVFVLEDPRGWNASEAVLRIARPSVGAAAPGGKGRGKGAPPAAPPPLPPGEAVTR